ncbi:GNAT family N-acetyltransferase [Congregibacter brevis]|uniref:GNAT family N-acetyltransferase n=1 Tax=Congregibacter brevis TaxID=3081201 RepID=A0ABZ0IH86_9GAMM|nr:GNAT family N-acetyltransferase [Congregibacter sp. IMCC45268]
MLHSSSPVFAAASDRFRVQLRNAKISESEELSEIAREAKSYWGYSASDLAKWEAELQISESSIAEQLTFAVQMGCDLAGLFQLKSDENEIDLEHFWVKPSFIGKGVGKTMLQHALQIASSLGASEIHIDADPNAEGFYTSRGAVRVAEVLAPIASQPTRVRPQMVLRTNAT